MLSSIDAPELERTVERRDRVGNVAPGEDVRKDLARAVHGRRLEEREAGAGARQSGAGLVLPAAARA